MPLDTTSTSAWPSIEHDIRKVLLARGAYAHEVDTTLAALAPVVAAVERAGSKVDLELAWALLAVECDRQRRRIQALRSRRPTAMPRKMTVLA